MSGFEKQTYTQVPNSLFDIMSGMDECELKVVLYICRHTFGYHREEIKISTRKLADAIGMNTASVAKGAEAAVARGLIEKIIDGQKTTIWRALVSDSDCEPLVIQNLNHGDSQNESQVGVKERLKKESKQVLSSMPLEWKLAHGEAITDEDVKQPTLENNALIEFERALGFGTLPWDSNTIWTSFKKFVIKIYAANPKVFADYKEWRDGEGKYKAFSNRKIRENPKMFMDTGYPEYEASKMSHKTDEARPEYKRVADEPVVRVPRPANLPRPNIPNLRGVQ